MKVNRLFETWLKCDVPNLTTAVVASSDFLQVNQEPSVVINLLYVSAAHTTTRNIATATPCSPHPRWRQVTGHTCHISMPKAAARAGPTSSLHLSPAGPSNSNRCYKYKSANTSEQCLVLQNSFNFKLPICEI